MSFVFRLSVYSLARSPLLYSKKTVFDYRKARLYRSFDTWPTLCTSVRCSLKSPISIAVVLFSASKLMMRIIWRLSKLSIYWLPTVMISPFWLFKSCRRSWLKLLVYSIENSGPCFIKVIPIPCIFKLSYLVWAMGLFASRPVRSNGVRGVIHASREVEINSV